MRWLYRLQQRIAITRSESWALLAVVGLLGGGLVALHIQSQPQTLPGDPYAEANRLFAQGRAQPDSLRSDSAAVETTADSAAAVDANARAPARAAVPPKLTAASTVRINVNTAPSAELQRLPRIGPKMAGRIIAHRTERGPFQRVDDLERVRGIGDKTMDMLRPHVTVE